MYSPISFFISAPASSYVLSSSGSTFAIRRLSAGEALVIIGRGSNFLCKDAGVIVICILIFGRELGIYGMPHFMNYRTSAQ